MSLNARNKRAPKDLLTPFMVVGKKMIAQQKQVSDEILLEAS